MGFGFGKVFLAGEYAVLHGKTAVVMGLDLKAIGMVVAKNTVQSAFKRIFVDPVLESSWNFLSSSEDVIVDTSEFYDKDQRKLGIGSSAATLVASLHTVLCSHREPLLQDSFVGGWKGISPILSSALSLHRAAQGGLGSGADVLASALGGVIAIEVGAEVRIRRLGRSLPSFGVLASRRPASTVSFLRAVQGLSGLKYEKYLNIIENLGIISKDLVNNLEECEFSKIVSNIASWDEAICPLGELLGHEVVTPEHWALKLEAESAGLAARICGAGGGDVSLVMGEDSEKLAEFLEFVAPRFGYLPISTTIAPERDVFL